MSDHVSTLVASAASACAPPAPDLATLRVTNIEVKFRPALPGEDPNVVVPYIDITRANGAHQTLGAYPVGGTPFTHEGGQLTFAAGQEKRQPTAAAFELHAPTGTTLTEYGNRLVDAAKAYNAHALRYDGIGERGVNGASFASSLIVAQGGAAGLADVKRIASVVDPIPVHTAGQSSRMDDARMALDVERALKAGHIVAPGWSNAAIPPQAFTHDKGPAAAKPPAGIPLGDLISAAPALAVHIGTYASAEYDRLRGATQPHVLETTPPYLSGGTMHIVYAGHEREVDSGYRQSGTILRVENGIVTQSAGRNTVQYKLSDLTADAANPTAMEQSLVPGRDVQIEVGSHHVHVTSLDRNQDLAQAQKHPVEHGGR